MHESSVPRSRHISTFNTANTPDTTSLFSTHYCYCVVWKRAELQASRLDLVRCKCRCSRELVMRKQDPSTGGGVFTLRSVPPWETSPMCAAKISLSSLCLPPYIQRSTAKRSHTHISSYQKSKTHGWRDPRIASCSHQTISEDGSVIISRQGSFGGLAEKTSLCLGIDGWIHSIDVARQRREERRAIDTRISNEIRCRYLDASLHHVWMVNGCYVLWKKVIVIATCNCRIFSCVRKLIQVAGLRIRCTTTRRRSSSLFSTTWLIIDDDDGTAFLLPMKDIFTCLSGNRYRDHVVSCQIMV